jgi:hypothetical protein
VKHADTLRISLLSRGRVPFIMSYPLSEASPGRYGEIPLS